MKRLIKFGRRTKDEKVRLGGGSDSHSRLSIESSRNGTCALTLLSGTPWTTEKTSKHQRTWGIS